MILVEGDCESQPNCRDCVVRHVPLGGVPFALTIVVIKRWWVSQRPPLVRNDNQTYRQRLS
jgi:hypothetical protein